MNSKTLELRPDRSLLDPSFDGYKLCLQNVEIIQKNLEVPVDRLLPDANQYSLLHARLFGFHNHLTGDSTQDADSVYFVDAALKVQKTYKDPVANHLVDCTEVWQIPDKNMERKGDYNVSLKFFSDSFAALSNAGTLYILDTGSRSKNDSWNVLFSGDVVGIDNKFVIADAVYRTDCKSPEIHVLLISIFKEVDEKCSTVLHWVTFSKIKNVWGQSAMRVLKSNGTVHYSYLERTCGALYVVSDNGCKFTLDSENPIQEKSESTDVKIVKYTWTQHKEDITIKYKLEESSLKTHLSVMTTPDSINVLYNSAQLLSGKLYGRINANMTSWAFEDNTLEITVIKSEVGQMWPDFVIGDPFGEFIPDPSLVAERRECLDHLTGENEVTNFAAEVKETEQHIYTNLSMKMFTNHN